MAKITITARDIVKLLEKKHHEDVFVSECKTGETWGARNSVGRLDAWAMKRSWAKPYIHGYEIKVSRSDFLNDEKWDTYVKYCTHFWFVAPAGIIDKSELPEGVGLLECSKNAKRLVTKRKAAGDLHKEIPAEIFKYILMSRTKVVHGAYEQYNVDGGPLQKSKDRVYWEEWMAMKRENREFGWRLRTKISDEINKKINDAEYKMKEAKAIAEKNDRISKFAEGLGINMNRTWDFQGEVEKKLKNFLDQFDPDDIKLISEASDKLALLACRMADAAE